jgi:hypothetical protein
MLRMLGARSLSSSEFFALASNQLLESLAFRQQLAVLKELSPVDHSTQVP